MLGGLGYLTEQILADSSNAASAPSVPALFCSMVQFMNEAGIPPNDNAQTLYQRVLAEM